MKTHFINKTGVIVGEEEMGKPYEVYWKRKSFANSRNDEMNKGFKELSLWMKIKIFFASL